MALVHEQLLEYFLAHYLLYEQIWLLEVWEQDHEYLLRVLGDLNKVYDPGHVMEIPINHFSLRVYPMILRILERHRGWSFPLWPQLSWHASFACVEPLRAQYLLNTVLFHILKVMLW